MTSKKAILVLLALSIATHFAFFGHPNETVFDEVHFGKFVSGYYTGEYYFDIHPPLGKLIIAGFAKIVDFKPEYNFTDIGKEFPDKKYLALRFLPALAGTLLPVIIFLLALQIGISKVGAFAAGLLVVFDNALLTQSRLILLDPFLLLFGFTSLLFYFKYRSGLNTYPAPSNSADRHSERGRAWYGAGYLLLTTTFGGLAVSIKWTGLGFIALPVLIEAAKNLKIQKTDIKLAIASFMSVLRFAAFFAISLIIYFSVFALHFALLPKPGPGDAFMKPNFREQNVIKNVVDLNIEMYKSNQRLTATHPYSSQWYTWPSMARPIYYWVDSNPSPQVKDSARIYFFGNPVVWWSSTIAVIYFMITAIRKKGLFASRYSSRFYRGSSMASPSGLAAILLVGHWLNLLPFIGVKRVMFLYHYLIPLIFAVLMLCYLIDRQKNSHKIFTGLIIASVVVFLFLAPLNYGLPLSEKAYSIRVWFASWR